MDYLSHHGILGMKWGVRRYQNKDGSLTPAGKKRISKEYKNIQIRANKQLASNYNNLYINAYNKSADYMNNGGAARFNSRQKKLYGKDFSERDGYEQDFEDEFNKLVSKNLNKTVAEFIDNNADYKKAKDLVDKYGMLEWDSLAKQNAEDIYKIRKNS